MKMFSIKRFIGACAVILTAVFLYGCGGGGSAVVTPPGGGGTVTVASPSGTLAYTPATVSLGQSGVTTTVVWTSTNTTGVITLVLNGAASTIAANGNKAVTLPHGTNTVLLKDGVNVLGSATFAVGCGSGDYSATAGICKLVYTDKVMAAWTNGWLYDVTTSGRTEYVNNSVLYPKGTGGSRLTACKYSTPKVVNSDGTVPRLCTYARDGVEYLFEAYPGTKEVRDPINPAPTGVTWSSVDQTCLESDTKCPRAQTASGLFYADNSARWNVYFEPTVGAVTSVFSGNPATDGTVKWVSPVTSN